MPEISRFLGITIFMYFDDHVPPHFHARYAERSASITIGSWETIDGSLPRRALALVREWAAIHEAELIANWHRAERHAPLVAIPPLE